MKCHDGNLRTGPRPEAKLTDEETGVGGTKHLIDLAGQGLGWFQYGSGPVHSPIELLVLIEKVGEVVVVAGVGIGSQVL